ncbi:MAG: GNAT family N-acetyltransferase [Deltaproteobacteria bacterium]|nr:GNAT family N-acetyltransferase [Deltaproteobacteria bacterium]
MEITIRRLRKDELHDADRIIRLAFGTFLGVPDPAQTFGDSDIAYTRYEADPDAVLAAEAEGKLVGSNFVTNWGSFGFFGPLTVEPKLWNQKVAQRLLEPTLEMFKSWGCRHSGLFTFSHSPTHLALYQKFGYWARFLTPVMSKQPAVSDGGPYTCFSKLAAHEKEAVLSACRETTGKIDDGLDLSREIRAVEAHKLGDTILLNHDSKVTAFAVCHVGPRTEAGSGVCYVKFGAVRPEAGAQNTFERLLDSCEAFAASKSAKLVAGVNLSHHEAYRTMVGRGFRTDLIGVAMQERNEPGYKRGGVYVLDDWR